MAAFEYTALNPQGAKRRGVVEADSERQARRQLRDQNLVPLTVEASRRHSEEAGIPRPFRRTRLSGDQLALLTRLLGTLLGSGLPIDDALSALARQSDSRASQRIVLGIRARVLEGRPLADGMAQFPHVFPDVYRATVGAGEQTRHLPLVLRRLADFVEARDRILKRVRLAMVYPAVLSVVALCALGFLLAYVVPEVVKVFENVQHQLPVLTRGLIATSAFARRYGLAVVALALLAAFAIRSWLQRPGPRFALHLAIARLPIVGKLTIENDMARFSRMLAIMLGSSVDMLDALNIASQSIGLMPLRKHVRNTVESVREGEALSHALSASPLMPPLLIHLCASGEAGGNLVEMLDTAAEAFEYRVQNSLALIVSLLEPLLILVMGGLVLTIVIAILLPIFEMNQLV